MNSVRPNMKYQTWTISLQRYRESKSWVRGKDLISLKLNNVNVI